MSAKHPTPWTVIHCNNGARGKWYCEWGNIVDDHGIFVVEGMDLATAREIAEAVNERDRLRNALLNAKTRFSALAMSNGEWRTCAENHVREIAAALGEGAE